MASLRTLLAKLPWPCRKVLTVGISYYGWKLVGTGGHTHSASYCYGVWQRHLTMAHQHGLGAPPHTVVELGPGSSIGVGLAALLSGVSWYVGFDCVRHADPQRDVRLLDELVELYRTQGQEVPSTRVETIRKELTVGGVCGGSSIQYMAPWDGRSSGPVRRESVDLVCAHVVMEYVQDLDAMYALFAKWVRPGGIVSSQIDFSSHTLTRDWNGHWAVPPRTWRHLEGTRPYRLNRQPHSVHIQALKQHGFDIVCDVSTHDESRITRHELTPQFANLTDQDLVTRSAFIQAKKPLGSACP